MSKRYTLKYVYKGLARTKYLGTFMTHVDAQKEARNYTHGLDLVWIAAANERWFACMGENYVVVERMVECEGV